MTSLAWKLSTAQAENLRNGERALRLAKAAIEKDKKSPLGYLVMGTAHAELNDFKKALKSVKKALSRQKEER